jgi:hypothetical protein
MVKYLRGKPGSGSIPSAEADFIDHADEGADRERHWRFLTGGEEVAGFGAPKFAVKVEVGSVAGRRVADRIEGAKSTGNVVQLVPRLFEVEGACYRQL